MNTKYCSIGIVHYAQQNTDDGVSRSEQMKESILSLKENTDYPAEIIVMDNGGNPDDSNWLLDKVRDGTISTLIRYRENMSFAFAWNQFARIATGDYLCFTCNDIRYHKGWLSSCVNLLEKYSDRKLIAAPYITPDKDRPNFNKEVLEDARINSLAGSNCMIMKYDDFKTIGEMPQHRVGGSVWHRSMVRAGYLVIIPPTDMVTHLGYRKGVDWRKGIKVERTLLNGEKVDFSYGNYRRNVYHGTQKSAGNQL